MKRVAAALLLSLAVVVFSSCYTVRISLKDEAVGAFKQNPDQPEFAQRAMVGAFRDKLVPVQDRVGDTTADLHAVEIENNLLYDLIGVITLGLYRPIEVRYFLTQPFQTTPDPVD